MTVSPRFSFAPTVEKSETVMRNRGNGQGTTNGNFNLKKIKSINKKLLRPLFFK